MVDSLTEIVASLRQNMLKLTNSVDVLVDHTIDPDSPDSNDVAAVYSNLDAVEAFTAALESYVEQAKKAQEPSDELLAAATDDVIRAKHTVMSFLREVHVSEDVFAALSTMYIALDKLMHKIYHEAVLSGYSSTAASITIDDMYDYAINKKAEEIANRDDIIADLKVQVSKQAEQLRRLQEKHATADLAPPGPERYFTRV